MVKTLPHCNAVLTQKYLPQADVFGGSVTERLTTQAKNSSPKYLSF